MNFLVHGFAAGNSSATSFCHRRKFVFEEFDLLVLYQTMPRSDKTCEVPHSCHEPLPSGRVSAGLMHINFLVHGFAAGNSSATSFCHRSAETRWMVVMDGAKILFERWDEIAWLFGDLAACNIGKTAYRNYWLKFAVALEDPLILVQVIFAARLGELVFDWAYNWIRGKGGFFLKGEGVGRRLFPGMRLVEVADFS
ncbi:unnamed protein product [Ectocarpus sp. CCAP 1310/34]|nr:unnamed protein product [Ectocarpus sp. CCAP 1310/34]